MKKLIALAICAVMVLSMIPAMALTASAAGEGMWTTVRGGNDYDDPESYTPAAGYTYTSEGFQTVSADFTDTTPFYTVQTKEPVDIKEGVHVEFRIDQFSYRGEDGSADEWISLSIWSQDKPVPGSPDFGGGWSCLLRGAGDGTADCQSFWTIPSDKEAGIAGSFNFQGNASVTAPMDDNGCETYTLDIAYAGGEYTISVNDVVIAGNSAVSNNLKELVASGNYYIGLTFHSGVKNGVADLTILDYNGSKPTGSDSKDPEENVNVFAPLTPADQVEANKPCLLFDATKSSFSKDPDPQNLLCTAMGDNSYKFVASGGVGFFSWGISHKYTFNAEDFPVLAILFKDYWGSGSVRYGAGDVMSADDTHNVAFVEEDTFGADQEYSLCVVDFSEEGVDWEGRINFARLDLGGTVEGDEFYICYMGFFRSVEEAKAYTDAYVNANNIVVDDATEKDTEVATDPADETKKPDETKAPDESKKPEETKAPDESKKPEETKDETTAGGDSEGCASVIGGAAALVLAAMAAAVALKKN